MALGASERSTEAKNHLIRLASDQWIKDAAFVIIVDIAQYVAFCFENESGRFNLLLHLQWVCVLTNAYPSG
jgi:hypothetical protein